MTAGIHSGRRFFSVMNLLIILTTLNVGLFWYLHKTNTPAWSFIEKTDDTILLGKVELLEGGYLSINDIYQLVYTPPSREARVSEQFQLEAFGTGVVNVIPVASFHETQIGPADVRQWGAVPKGSNIEKRLEQLETEQNAS